MSDKKKGALVNKYNYLDLFSGIGGFALGAEWADVTLKKHFFSEIDPYAISVYRQNFPDSFNLGNIENLDLKGLKKKYGKKWIINGGFPCQDISGAGKGAGIGGSRSGLWFEMWRLIGQLRPDFVIVENVGLLARRGLSVILANLAEIGYDAEWQDIRAEDMGAPHKRERLWIVAYPTAPGWYGRISYPSWEKRDFPGRICGEMADGQGLERSRYNRIDGQNIREKEKFRAGGYGKGPGSSKKMADADGQRRENREPAIASRGNTIPLPGDGSSQSRRHEGWAVEPDVGRVANGVPFRVDRIKCLGNSIVPQIAKEIFELIKNAEEKING